jgi:hypothetical protein
MIQPLVRVAPASRMATPWTRVLSEMRVLLADANVRLGVLFSSGMYLPDPSDTSRLAGSQRRSRARIRKKMIAASPSCR